MHFSLWKPLSSLIMDKRSRRKHGPTHDFSTDESETNPSILEQPSEEDGSLVKSDFDSGTLARPNAQKEFVAATALAAGPTLDSFHSIPILDRAFSEFLTMYPKFLSSEKIDLLRSSEYTHLSGPKVCLDYCGFGLFSLMQTVHHWESSSFTLSEITANLTNQVLHSGPDVGMVERDMKARIMDYLNVPETEYGLVFTTSRGSAFRLLSDSYPFRTCGNLLTMFDHESQSVNSMAERARGDGARVQSAGFEWPTLKLCSAELQKHIVSKRRKKSKGLFVFPVQSRVTGAKYSYQWMALAQQNNWHVLLDAGALGPKDMDSLGLSLFRPDFIIASFYRVFGYDPTGFGCLLIKKSVMSCLKKGSGRAGPGMVRIVPIFPTYLSDSGDDFTGVGEEDDEVSADGVEADSGGKRSGSQLPAFSGAYTSAQVRDMFKIEMDLDNSSDKDGSSTLFEDSESISIGEMMKSPVFSEDQSFDSSLWIDLGFSPFGSDNAGHPFKHKVASSSPLPPAWFSSRNNNNNKLAKLSHSPIHEEGSNLGHCENLPVFQETKHVQDIAEEEQVFEGNNQHFQEIKEEPEIVVTGPTSKNESAIRRETEGGFRLLQRRENGRSREGRRVSFKVEENCPGKISHSVNFDDDGYTSNGEYGDLDSSRADEPEILCEHLDHADTLGLSRTTSRLRFLINWLVSSLLRLRLSGSGWSEVDGPLVHIYGPKIKYERGAAVAFNIKDRNNRGLISPEVVQKLAEFNDISLGVGILSHVRLLDGHGGSLNLDETTLCKPMENGGRSGFVRVEVVTASLGFLSNFEDVYRLWAFVAKFLEPDFVKEGGVLPTLAKDVQE